MRRHRLFTLASGDPIVRPPDVIECASIKEANTAAEALSITASLRGYFDDLLSPPRPKRTVKMERVVVSVKNCQMVLTRIGETTPSFSEIRNRRALPRLAVVKRFFPQRAGLKSAARPGFPKRCSRAFTAEW